jgi:hypothetical protein
MIKLKRGDDVWVAEYSGSMADRIRAIFGQTVIPTAYSITMQPWEVRDRVAATNPGQTVVVDAAEPLAPARISHTHAPRGRPVLVCSKVTP